MSLGLSHSLSRWELSIVKPTSVLNLRLIQVQTQVLSGQGGHDGNSSHRSVRRPRQGDQHLLDEGEGNTRSIIRVLLELTYPTIAGMVRLAFPRARKDHRRQSSVRQGDQAHGLQDERRHDRFRFNPPRRPRSHRQSRRRNLHGHRNLRLRHQPHPFPMRPSHLYHRLPYTTRRVPSKSNDRDRTEPNRLGRGSRWCPINQPCWQFAQSR